MSIVIRPITEDEVVDFQKACVDVFGGEFLQEASDRFSANHPLERTATAFEGATIVGTSADMPFDLTVPGGVLPLAGLTMVTVRPTHRRRGVMSSMVRVYMDQAHERGDPVGGLWAAEWPIYGRFGFGVATDAVALAFDGRQVEIAGEPSGHTLTQLGEDEVRDVLPAVYERARRRRPGTLGRSLAWWDERLLFDPPQWRHGASASRHVVASIGDAVTGYVTYRQKPHWDGGHAVGEVQVTEVIAIDGDTERALWRFLSRIDLHPKVRWEHGPADPALIWLASDGRKVERRVDDGLWVRLIDVPAALAGRRYQMDGTLAIRVVDAFCPWNDGTFRLSVEEGAAECERSDSDPHITLSASTLAALYLGGRSATVLADAGLIEGTAEAVVAADTMFRWDRAPWCPEVF
ncbi:MAG: GNAT family N-acetyltransferase [Acidimicrobiia bacterium]|jgi:predicted acetyltransferase